MNHFYFFETVQSTNDFGKKIAKQTTLLPAVIVARRQDKGKGQQQRYWYSEVGGLYFSYVCIPQFFDVEHPEKYPLKIGQLLAEIINRVTNLECYVKAPNDIYLDGKKLAGILIETISRSQSITAVIVGIGLNVNQESFSTAISDKAVSIKQRAKQYFDTILFINELIKELPNVFTRY